MRRNCPGGRTRRAALPLLARAAAHGDRVAIADGEGEHGYAELLAASGAVAETLLARAGAPVREEGPVAGGRGQAADLGEARVAFMAPPGFAYVAAQWGIWRTGGIALPLCTSHPPRELAYALDDAGATLALAHPAFEATLGPLAREREIPLVTTEGALAGRGGPAGDPGSRDRASDDPGFHDPGSAPRRLPTRIDEARGAMILYTSGTTGPPRGVLHTHRSLRAQVESLAQAWAWAPEDRILHVLPLHHTHGIVNALLCALWAGAACELLPSFDAEAAWERFAAGARGTLPPITLFMAVPTVYVKLIAAWEEASEERRRAWSAGARSLRLMVSGSAALPASTFRRWREITGHDLLERYGMTEVGMALSNPLDGERRPGTVGRPLPGVSLRLVGEGGETLAEEAGPPLRGEASRGTAGGSGHPTRESVAAAMRPPGASAPPPDTGPGEIRVRGPSLFRDYWGRPEATAEAFEEGWFRTGDVAAVEDGYWRILGRSSVDIIKSGGYKISALEIEEALRAHPDVADCAVVGLPDPEWGERVAAAVVAARSSAHAAAPGGGGARESDRGASAPEAAGLRRALDAWARERLAGYKVPRRWLVLDRLPRNALGKVTKPDVKAMFGGGQESP